MDATILPFSVLAEWSLQHRVLAPMILDAEIVDATTMFPAMFHSNVPSIERLNDPTSLDLVQVVTFAKLGKTDAIKDLVNKLPNVPLVVIVFQYDEDGEKTAVPSSMFTVIKQRHDLLTRWQTSDDKSPEFLRKSAPIFSQVAAQLQTGGTASLTTQFQANLQKEVQLITNAGARFLTMKKAVKDEDAKPGAKPPEKKVRTVMSYSFSDGIEDVNIAPVPQPTGDPEDPNPTSDLDAELSQLTDPLSVFLRYAGGTYGSTVSKLYRHKPVAVYRQYTSWRKLMEYCTATRDWVVTALRRVQNEASKWALSIHKKRWYLLAVLCHPESDMFFMAARLCGLYMRDAELQQVTRTNRTLNDLTKHMKDVNDSSYELISEIRKHPGLCCNFLET